VPVAELSDEFSGRSIDQEKWQVEPVGNDFTWIGRPPGLFQAKNIKQKGGKLRVEVGVLDEPQVIEGDTFLYYGGIVRSWNPGQHGWYYVGTVSPLKEDWVGDWDQIFHSNAIHRRTECNPEPTQIQGQMTLRTKNWERYYVYGCWWKSPDELRFYLDGEYVYSIKPSIGFNMPAYLHMAIETYDWNPVTEDGGLLAKMNRKGRTTSYDWIRTWRLE